MQKKKVGQQHLSYGDIVIREDGSKLKVESVETEKLKEEIKVYNFEVEDFHTYFVGENRILVHNTCGVKPVDKVVERVSNPEIITDPSRLLEAPKEVADHHLIPAFRGKSKPYADFIKQRGINVDDFTITVSSGKGGQHMNFIHGKGKWNQKWMGFIDNNPNATAKDIYQFTGKMMDDYGLSGYPIHPYKK